MYKKVVQCLGEPDRVGGYGIFLYIGNDVHSLRSIIIFLCARGTRVSLYRLFYT